VLNATAGLQSPLHDPGDAIVHVTMVVLSCHLNELQASDARQDGVVRKVRTQSLSALEKLIGVVLMRPGREWVVIAMQLY
jgi:hypothetical protein